MGFFNNTLEIAVTGLPVINYRLIFTFLLAAAVTYFAIPVVIKTALKKNLVDNPNERKMHKTPIPTLGGVAIFIGILCASAIWIGYYYSLELLLIFVSVTILFITGIVDDLTDMSALKKLAIQIFVSLIVAWCGVRIQSLGGIFGIYEIPVILQYLITIALVAGVTNAFNLIDGIDGLAGGITFINAIFLGLILLFSDKIEFAFIAFSLAGALLAFLKYNFNPAKIFMGDTGSLIIGFIMAVIGISALQCNSSILSSTTAYSPSLFILITGIILLPVYDMLRVFFVRIVLEHKSPFSADKNHTHHLLIETKFNHKKATIVLYISNIIIIITAFFLRGFDPVFSICLLFILAVILSEGITLKRIFIAKFNEIFLSKRAKVLVRDNKYLNKIMED